MINGWGDIKDYPELKIIQNNYLKIKDESFSILNDMMSVEDDRVNGTWKFAPLKYEKIDETDYIKKTSKKCNSKISFTNSLLNDIDIIKNYSFSYLGSNSEIKSHSHHQKMVTGILTLDCGNDSYIEVDGYEEREKKFFEEGQFLFFDYSLFHRVVNNDEVGRMVLLLLLPLK